ncbi:hypothetical protein BANRA_00282 [Acinetobacter baumannii]|nr:hypothetical protein BANRA_00282 [Acinetobacter baumannii]
MSLRVNLESGLGRFKRTTSESGGAAKAFRWGIKETQYALQYVEEDMRGNHEFLQMAMIRTLKAIEQVLKGGA